MPLLFSRVAVFWIVLFSFVAFPVVAVQGAEKCDSHLHFYDFTHTTDGFPKLIQAMDAAKVDKAIVFGMPILKMWSESDPVRPAYYLATDSRAYYYSATDLFLARELERQPQSVRDRFFPFLCGINPLDRNAAAQIESLIQAYPGLWMGIGEVMSRHDDLTAYTYGEPPRANHPALLAVYEVARKHKLPVLIHHNISSAGRNDPIYLAEMEDALRRFPDVTFIWAHVGISRRVDVPTLPEVTTRLLDQYPNLLFDISWVVFDDYIAKNKASLRTWVRIFEKYPDRFLIGSDVVAHWGKYQATMDRYRTLLRLLSPQTREKLAGGNALGLMERTAAAR
ncbi:amidohydrolase family protein [Fundidesulfovibrio butyratiphilus]